MIAEVEQRARQLYDACTPVKPEWDQLGGITQAVWRERAANLIADELL